MLRLRKVRIQARLNDSRPVRLSESQFGLTIQSNAHRASIRGPGAHARRSAHAVASANHSPGTDAVHTIEFGIRRSGSDAHRAATDWRHRRLAANSAS